MRAAPAREGVSAPQDNAGVRTRERILRASAQIFAARGYHAATMADIEAPVGCSRGTLYYHFNSKEQILFEICLSSSQRQLQQAKDIATRRDSVERTIALLIGSSLDEIFTHRDSVLVIQRELDSLSTVRRLTISSMRDEYETVWAELFARGAEEGMLRRIDRVELKALIGMLVHVGSWVQEGPLNRAELVERFGGLILRSLRV